MIDASIPLRAQTFSLGDILQQVEARRNGQANREYQQFQMQNAGEDRALRREIMQDERTARTDKLAREKQGEHVRDVVAAVRWADTPEKWDQVVDQFAREGYDYGQYRGRFDQRQSILVGLQGGLAGLLESQPKPERQQDFTLNPGSVRYDASGNIIASSPYRPEIIRDPVTGDVYEYGGGAPTAAAGPFNVTGVPGERVTSTRRTPERNAAVGGVPNSYHLSGQARDSVPPAGMSMSEYHAILTRQNPGMDVINEGDHVHIEPRGGSGGGGGPRRIIKGNKPPERPRPVQDTKSIGGKAYYKIDGRWYDNSEGR